MRMNHITAQLRSQRGIPLFFIMQRLLVTIDQKLAIPILLGLLILFYHLSIKDVIFFEHDIFIYFIS